MGGLYAARKVLRGMESVEAGAEPSTSPPRFAAVRLSHPQEAGTVEVLLPNEVRMRVSFASVEDLMRLVQDLSRLGR